MKFAEESERWRLARRAARGHARATLMKTTLPRFLAIAFATCALTAVAPAQDAKPEHKDKGPSKAALEKYDANKDGKLDDTETAKMNADREAKREADKKARLEKYDTNKDGKVDKTEAEAEKADKEKAKAEREKAKAEKQAAKEAKKAGHESKAPQNQN